MIVFPSHGRAAPHVEEWELLTDAEGQTEREEPTFMAEMVQEKSAVRFNYPSKCFILRAVPHCSALAGQAASEKSFSRAWSFYGDPGCGLTHV